LRQLFPQSLVVESGQKIADHLIVANAPRHHFYPFCAKLQRFPNALPCPVCPKTSAQLSSINTGSTISTSFSPHTHKFA
jgi:hypothetical protein